MGSNELRNRYHEIVKSSQAKTDSVQLSKRVSEGLHCLCVYLKTCTTCLHYNTRESVGVSVRGEQFQPTCFK